MALYRESRNGKLARAKWIMHHWFAWRVLVEFPWDGCFGILMNGTWKKSRRFRLPDNKNRQRGGRASGYNRPNEEADTIMINDFAIFGRVN